MTFGVAATERTEELIGPLREGRERAKSLDQPVLVSVAQQVSQGVDPLTTFATMGRPGAYRAFWARPAEKFWLVGIGTTTGITADGDRPLEKVEQAYWALLEGAVVSGPDKWGVGPVLMGGSRFDPHTPTTATWRDFPNALLALPRFLFTWSGNDCWLTTNFLVLPQTNIQSEAEAAVAQLEALATSPPDETYQPSVRSQCQTSREEWSRRVCYALGSIEKGHLIKVVLARKRVLYAHQPFSTERILDQLSSAYPECSVFGLDNGSSSFVGATPETLVHLQSGVLSLSSLAGTVGQGANPEEDQRLALRLLDSPKERLEHSTVVAMVAKALEGVCQELHWDAAPKVIKLRNLQHLRTSFAGRLKEATNILRLVELLHPTPALGGTPTERALETIRELEGDRGWYAGPVGWVDRRGEGEFSAAIRSALLCGDRATLFAGAGIVEGSDPEEEFEETELKFQPLLAALGQC